MWVKSRIILIGLALRVHKNENFFGFDFACCTISMLVMHT
jgi:hypothetical protein